MGPFSAPVACAVVTLMITPHGTAQAPSTSKTANPREASSGHASGREASSGMATGGGEASCGQASEREDQGPKASGAITEQGADAQASPPRSSAHATESLAPSVQADSKKMGSAQSNPLYQPNGHSSQSALYDSNRKSGAVVHQDYKDGEDQTTRTRPGNKKTN
jgi:hypothetical protein